MIFPKVRREWRRIDHCEGITGIFSKVGANYNRRTRTITLFPIPNSYGCAAHTALDLAHELVHHFAFRLKIPLLNGLLDSKLGYLLQGKTAYFLCSRCWLSPGYLRNLKTVLKWKIKRRGKR